MDQDPSHRQFGGPASAPRVKVGRRNEADAAEGMSLTETAVNVIRDRILDLTLLPGARIDDTLLASRFGLSRTPAREALNRLAAEGLVELQRNRGAIVRPLELRTVRELFEAYFACERMVGFFCRTHHPGLVEDLERFDRSYLATLRRKNFLELTKLNAAFHLRLAAATENEYIYEFAARLQNQGRRISQFIFLADAKLPDYINHQRKVTDDHKEIIRAVREHDNALLIDILTRHAALFHSRILRVVSAEGAEAAPLPVRPDPKN